MRYDGTRKSRPDAVAAAVLAALALALAGCTFDPNGIAFVRDGSIDAGDSAVDAADAAVPDGDLDGDLADANDGAPDDGAPIDVLVPTDAPDPDAFIFLDARIPDATIFLDAPMPDAQVDPGPGEIFGTPVSAGVTITVDGNVDSTTEWPRARCITLNRDNDAHTDDKDRNIVTGPVAADSSALFCVQWTSAGLYLAARVTDEVHQSNSFNIYDDDSIAFYLDGDNTRDGTVDGNDYAFMIAPPGRFGGTRSDDYFRNGLPANVQFAAQQRGNNADMDIEAFVPWPALGGTGAAGRRVGFEVNLLDDDSGGFNDTDYDDSMWWFVRSTGVTLCTGHEDPWCNPGTIGEIILR